MGRPIYTPLRKLCYVCKADVPKHRSNVCGEMCAEKLREVSVLNRIWKIPPRQCLTLPPLSVASLAPDRSAEPCRESQPPPDQPCPVCGKMFNGGNSRKVYCSDGCAKRGRARLVRYQLHYAGRCTRRNAERYVLGYNKRHPLVSNYCHGCGEQFFTRTDGKEFCGPKCRKRDWNKKWAAKRYATPEGREAYRQAAKRHRARKRLAGSDSSTTHKETK